MVIDRRWPCCLGTQCLKCRCWRFDRLMVERLMGLMGINERFVGWPSTNLGPGERHLDRCSELVEVQKQRPRHSCARARHSGHCCLALQCWKPQRRRWDSEHSLVEPSLGIGRCRMVSRRSCCGASAIRARLARPVASRAPQSFVQRRIFLGRAVLVLFPQGAQAQKLRRVESRPIGSSRRTPPPH